MGNKTFVIMGATGHIGHALVSQLLKSGNKVKALGRNQNKLSELKSLGAETIAIQDFTNGSALTDACKGADALFSFIPPAMSSENMGTYQDKVSEAIKTAIQKNNIRYVLNLSSIGAHLENFGPINGLRRCEESLNTLKDVNILHLRPGYFMENLFFAIPAIKQTNHLSTPVKGDLKIPMIATKDIATKAADLLNQLNFKGHTVFELEGPQEISLNEVAPILGKAIGQSNLTYHQWSTSEAEKGMAGFGMKPANIKLMLEMYQAMNDGRFQPTQKLNQDHKTRTTIQEFANTFAESFKNEMAHAH
jgi:uncharacterized protein YbjT (DUF2867 family)